MSSSYSALRSMLVLVALLSSLVPPTAASAEEGAAPDPYFTVAGVTYHFNTADCDPVTVDPQPCANPIQASIRFLGGTTASSPWFGVGAAPDDGNIYVEAGVYTEDIAIFGFSGWNFGANIPDYLGILGAGSDTTVLDGAFVVANMKSITLSGFTVKDTDGSGNVASISAHANTGTLELSDIIVISTDPGLDSTDDVGDGIHVVAHIGDIVLSGVDASDNSEDGAWLDNQAGTGSISVRSSDFSRNGGCGLCAQSNGDISFADVVASENDHSGANAINCNGPGTGSDCVGTGTVTVVSSDFSHNGPVGVPGIPVGHGFVVASNSDILLSDVTANFNNGHGALLVNNFVGARGTVTVRNSEFSDNGQSGDIVGDGLVIRSNGSVRLLGLTADRNLEHGIEASSGAHANGLVSLRDGHASENGVGGLSFGSTRAIEITGSVMEDNAFYGAVLFATKTVTVACSQVSNHRTGVWAEAPLLLLKGVRFSGNFVNYTNTGRTVVNPGCK